LPPTYLTIPQRSETNWVVVLVASDEGPGSNNLSIEADVDGLLVHNPHIGNPVRLGLDDKSAAASDEIEARAPIDDPLTLELSRPLEMLRDFDRARSTDQIELGARQN
jgi:hypothetical protein